MVAKDIKRLAEELKAHYGTNDPFVLARQFGIHVVISDTLSRDRKAYMIKMESYPTCIFISAKYDRCGQLALCAHELGHALMHNGEKNYFAVTKENVFTNVEYEANLFAVALLCDESDFNTQILSMSNYLLKTVLDFNMKEQGDV